MKFINYLTSISGIEIFPLISLLIFFLFFIGLAIYVFGVNKTHVSYMAGLPVNNEEQEAKNDNADNKQ